MSKAPRVTVAGGGLAGLTAALRLAERGYEVKLYEQKSMLGGDLATRQPPSGVELDVYPHMYLSWYHNFWHLLRDTGADRGEGFVPFSTIRQLRPGDFPNFTAITDVFATSRMWQNVFSGVGPPADMFVFGYADIDLLAEGLNPTMLLDNVSVTGFLHARPYMTERAAEACDNFITTIWAIPSYLAAAEDYRSYLAYSFADHTPAYWLTKGSALQRVIKPLRAALEDKGVEIVPSVQVTSVSCTKDRVTEVGLEDTRFDEDSYTWVGKGDGRTETVDELVLAVPPDALSSIVRTAEPGHRIVEAAPNLAQVSRLHTQQIPILHLCFTRKLPHIPPEPVGLFRSRLALAFTDISQIWEGATGSAGNTVLSVSASDPHGLPDTGFHDDALAIVRELAEYLHFNPGTTWGESSDIDWTRTRYEPNTDTQLFVNETGINVWRPPAACEGLSNLCFAGDFCANRIGMTTIESAVATGLEAARVIVDRRGVGAPVQIIEPDPGVDAFYVWLRYVWAPYAFAAKAWSRGSDCLRSLGRLLTPESPPGRQRRES